MNILSNIIDTPNGFLKKSMPQMVVVKDKDPPSTPSISSSKLLMVPKVSKVME